MPSAASSRTVPNRYAFYEPQSDHRRARSRIRGGSPRARPPPAPARQFLQSRPRAVCRRRSAVRRRADRRRLRRLPRSETLRHPRDRPPRRGADRAASDPLSYHPCRSLRDARGGRRARRERLGTPGRHRADQLRTRGPARPRPRGPCRRTGGRSHAPGHRIRRGRRGLLAARSRRRPRHRRPAAEDRHPGGALGRRRPRRPEARRDARRGCARWRRLHRGGPRDHARRRPRRGGRPHPRRHPGGGRAREPPVVSRPAALHIGTSGWHYAHWRGIFYPEKLAASKWLDYYAQQFDTVELNSTFYRLPTENGLATWRDSSPSGFLFAAKGSRFLTHMKKLKDPAPGLAKFFERVEGFLEALPPRHHYAFELRNPTWHTDAVYRLLHRHNAAFCIFEIAGF